MSIARPPNPDELEISIIGPGRGECILLHLGDDEWCVIDSCIARGRRESVAVEYLRNFQNDALERVKLIVATHWHDDHIRGLASLLTQIPSAQFSCSMALDTDIFATLVELSHLAVQSGSGVDEFAAIFELIKTRAAKRAKHLVAPMFAMQNHKLLQLAAPGRSFAASVTALSPSDGTVKLAFKDIAQWLPQAGDPQGRIINRAPNHTSVALWIEAGNRRVLLGADLEHTNRPGDGWVAVLESHQDKNPAAVFKVPHHGSQNADCPEVWTKMLVAKPVAVVTPFTGRLPRASDLCRIGARTPALYCTGKGTGKPPPRDPSVEKTVKRVVSERRVVEGQPGHVRVRWSVSEENAAPTVEMFNGAYHVDLTDPGVPTAV